MIFKTYGIVLRSIRYGESSLIVSMLTEKFGVQSYLVKGLSSSRNNGRIAFFQPAAILSLEVYHNKIKNLQYLKEYEWKILYDKIFSDVSSNAVALYMVEILRLSITRPEENSGIYALAEHFLHLADSVTDSLLADLPLIFTLQLCSYLGFGIQGSYSPLTPVLDLKEGVFGSVGQSGALNLLSGAEAMHLSVLLHYNYEKPPALSGKIRRHLLNALQDYLSIHIEDYKRPRSIDILSAILD